MASLRKASTSKAERARQRFFPNVPRFEPMDGQFSPLPWIYRRVQWLFRPRDWQLLTYLIMRSGPEAIVWMTDKQIAHDLDLGPRKVAPHLKELVARGFIAIAEGDGNRYIAVVDPTAAIGALVTSGVIHGDRLEALREDFDTLNLPLPSAPDASQANVDGSAEVAS